MLATLREDIKAVLVRDPAARSMLEILLCYPGLYAPWLHRMAHFLCRHGLNFCARLLSHINRFLRNVEGRRETVSILAHGKLPDPGAEAIRLILK